MEEKYIDLLLKKCLWFQGEKVLFISYYKENKKFVDKLVKKAQEIGVGEIYLEEEDIYEYHNLLKDIDIDKMRDDPHFDKSIWNMYADKNATFLMLDTEFPNIMTDIDPQKIAKATELRQKSKKKYREKQQKNEISWCIAAVANEIWAKDLFPNDEDALLKLENLIYDICMINEEDPIKAWDEKIAEVQKIVDTLNDLKIESLHYENSLGTDLTVSLPKEAIWCGVGADRAKGLVNMPSYEVFTSPDYRKTNGLVFSSKPLIYSGKKIDNFSIEFKNGKAIKVNAESEQDVLQGIIETDENNCYLGEVALVNNDSLISNTGLIFGTTLIDENASCHLALGSAFPECLKDGIKLNEKEQKEKGLNVASNHVDFMIGTEDLKITARTYDGEEIIIFENGNFVI